MDLGISNKVALVAAASKGLGRASALALAREGARLVICSRDRQGIEAAAKEIARETGATVLPVSADVSRPEDIDRLVATAKKEFGTVHILVNNAGGPPAGDFLTLTDEAWEQGFQLTLMSAVRMTRAVLPMMTRQGWGRVITITSIAAKQPIDELVISSALRPGLAGMSKILANQHGGKNITVNTVLPGLILTDRQQELGAFRAKQKGVSFEEYLSTSAASIPAGRLGEPREVGEVVAFLASERASYINGANILVDGGAAKGIL